jgi:hypothetical protein
MDFDLRDVEAKLSRESTNTINNNCKILNKRLMFLIFLVTALFTCFLPDINDGVLFVITPSACNISYYEYPNNRYVEIQGNSTVIKNFTVLYIQQHTTMEW